MIALIFKCAAHQSFRVIALKLKKRNLTQLMNNTNTTYTHRLLIFIFISDTKNGILSKTNIFMLKHKYQSLKFYFLHSFSHSLHSTTEKLPVLLLVDLTQDSTASTEYVSLVY